MSGSDSLPKRVGLRPDSMRAAKPLQDRAARHVVDPLGPAFEQVDVMVPGDRTLHRSPCAEECGVLENPDHGSGRSSAPASGTLVVRA
jgi:hypothetical protein